MYNNNMTKTIEEAKSIMEEGWKAREEFDFKKAKELLKEAMEIFESHEDWYNVTECLNHLAYTQKLKAQKVLRKGLEFVDKSVKIAQKNQTKDGSVLRAQMSLLSVYGDFETALKVARKLLSTQVKPANQADVLGHIAFFELRTGNPSSALKSIEQTEKLLDESWDEEREPHRSIWKVSQLVTKGLIHFHLGDKVSAKTAGEAALEIAKREDLQTRIIQAEAFLKLLDE